MLENLRRRAWRLLFAAGIGAASAQMHRPAPAPQRFSGPAIVQHHDAALAMRDAQ